MGIKVTKFGGSSLADATQFRKVIDILKSDTSRKYVVVSAPGKRFDEDVKVTDMLNNMLFTGSINDQPIALAINFPAKYSPRLAI